MKILPFNLFHSTEKSKGSAASHRDVEDFYPTEKYSTDYSSLSEYQQEILRERDKSAFLQNMKGSWEGLKMVALPVLVLSGVSGIICPPLGAAILAGGFAFGAFLGSNRAAMDRERVEERAAEIDDDLARDKEKFEHVQKETMETLKSYVDGAGPHRTEEAGGATVTLFDSGKMKINFGDKFLLVGEALKPLQGVWDKEDNVTLNNVMLVDRKGKVLAELEYTNTSHHNYEIKESLSYNPAQATLSYKKSTGGTFSSESMTEESINLKTGEASGKDFFMDYDGSDIDSISYEVKDGKFTALSPNDATYRDGVFTYKDRKKEKQHRPFIPLEGVLSGVR